MKYDVTMKISPTMQVYKNKDEKRPVFLVASSVLKGDSTNETKVTFNVHTGTHLDFPRHIYNEGKTSKDFDLTSLICDVKVLDLIGVKEGINVEDLTHYDINRGDFLLFKTRNSYSDDFNFNFVFLSEEAARYLARLKISGVGIDALGIERNQKGHPTHKTLIDNDIYIIEGLRLKDVPSGDYKMLALPLKLDDVDALPLSVVLESK